MWGRISKYVDRRYTEMNADRRTLFEVKLKEGNHVMKGTLLKGSGVGLGGGERSNGG
jgi:hypothetical protein